MGRRGENQRKREFPGGVELTNFVEMTSPLFETAALRTFLDAFRPFADRLTGWGADWIMSSACFREDRPFGILHNVSVVNPHNRSVQPEIGTEIDRLQPKRERERAWLAVAHHFPVTCANQIRKWLPRPRMRCIHLERATERLKQFTHDWIEVLGYSIDFFAAYDRRELERGNVYFPYDEAAAHKRIQRPLSHGEIACANSHALLMHEELEYCGPEGTIIFEDDCLPLSGADRLFERIQNAVRALPGVEVVTCHEPKEKYCIYESAGDAVRVKQPAWGTALVWYSPSGLRKAFELMSRVDAPADRNLRNFATEKKLAMLQPAVASHVRSDTTYIGNQYRGTSRRFIS